jgi:hypothetical protein
MKPESQNSGARDVLRTHPLLCNGHESQRDRKPRITVLARASSKLLRCTALPDRGQSHYSVTVWRKKIRWWVPRGPEPRTTVLAKARSNLPETEKLPDQADQWSAVSRQGEEPLTEEAVKVNPTVGSCNNHSMNSIINPNPVSSH